MLKIIRFDGGTDYFQLGFVEREATPEPAVKLGIHLHLAGLSLSGAITILGRLDIDRSQLSEEGRYTAS